MRSISFMMIEALFLRLLWPGIPFICKFYWHSHSIVLNGFVDQENACGPVLTSGSLLFPTSIVKWVSELHIFHETLQAAVCFPQLASWSGLVSCISLLGHCKWQFVFPNQLHKVVKVSKLHILHGGLQWTSASIVCCDFLASDMFST